MIKKSKRVKKKHNYTFLLSGLLKCPECGSSMVMNRSRYTLKDGTVKHQNYYVCGQHRSKSASACHANGIRKEEAEEYVLNRFGELISNEKTIHDLVDRINAKRKNKVQPLQDELEQIENKLKQAREKKEKYFDLFEKGTIDSSLITQKINKISDELKKLKSRRKKIESELEEDGTQPVTFELVENVLKNFNMLIDQESGEKLKNLLKLAIKEITINEDKEIDSIKLAFDEDVQKHFLNGKNENNNADKGSSNNEDPS
jgi:site-specific DNA recombinase